MPWPPSSNDWSRLPEHIRGGIGRYVGHGVKPGSFLTAVICNNLKEAFMTADQTNTYNMQYIVGFFYNHVPQGAWGSPGLMEEWIEKGGLEGK